MDNVHDLERWNGYTIVWKQILAIIIIFYKSEYVQRKTKSKDLVYEKIVIRQLLLGSDMCNNLVCNKQMA